MSLQKSLKAFIFLSLALAIFEIFFLAYNYQKQKDSIENTLQDKVAQVSSSFDLVYAGTRQRMLEIASYVANSEEIQQAFLAGRKAVEKEGGGAGGVETAEARKRLLQLSLQGWKQMEERFDFRQMHFHLPPGATSFLRVHEPEKYGDDLSSIRHTIVAANEKHEMISGFETGRAHSGIRGAYPVFARDLEIGKWLHVGTLEFGTSFKHTIETLANNQGVDLAILLDMEQLKGVVWLDVLKQKMQENGIVKNYLIEETTIDDTETFFQDEDVAALLKQEGVELHSHADSYHWFASIPLRDYLGEQDSERAAAGRILVWQDATESMLLLRKNLRDSIFIAVLGFFLFQGLLWLVLKMTTGKLEDMVTAGRAELAEKNELLEEDIRIRRQIEKQNESLITDLQKALEEVRTLTGLLPICAFCKKIRDDSGYWNVLEEYVIKHSDAEFTHGICEDCIDKYYPEARE